MNINEADNFKISKNGISSSVKPSEQSKRSTPDVVSFGGNNKNSRDQDRHVLLNAYSLEPCTVPPFALDATYSKFKFREQQISENDHMFKDTFLASHSDKWSEFLQNSGGNSAYTSRILAGMKNAGPLNVNGVIESSSSSSDDKDEKLAVNAEYDGLDYDEHDNNEYANTGYCEEAERVRKEVFQNLDGEWGGGKRLDAIFNAPIPDQYELGNQRDRNEWFKYITQLKAFYYLKHESSEQSQVKHPYDDGILQTMLHKGRDELRKKKRSWAKIEQEKKKRWIPRIRRLLLQSQYLPLSLRFVIGVLCIVSLALATRIFQNSESGLESSSTGVPQQPSTIMALCVNSIAIVYLIYIGYDEFSGKPLGIRDPMDKLRLIMLDLLFIIFSSANLSLAFATLYDGRWVCQEGSAGESQLGLVGFICRKQKALASFLFLVLITWVITFTISIARVVEKVSSGTQR